MEPLIVYIIADNRSGSTLLDYMLSCHPEAITLGEVHHLHGHYFRKGTGAGTDWNCSCGQSVQNCDFWSKILKEISFSEDLDTCFTKKNSKLEYFSDGFLKKSIDNNLNNKIINRKGRLVAENIWKIYQAVFKLSGKSVIIDSSKSAYMAFFLKRHQEGNIRFLLLERNISAVASSKFRRRLELMKKLKAIKKIKKGSIYWDLLSSSKYLNENKLLSDKIQKEEGFVKRIRYEDLAEFPEKTMRDIYAFLHLDYFMPPQATHQGETLQHVLCGSPSRFDTKEITPDIRWKSFYRNKPIAKLLGNLLDVRNRKISKTTNFTD